MNPHNIGLIIQPKASKTECVHALKGPEQPRNTPARSPWRAHVACVPRLRQRQSFERMHTLCLATPTHVNRTCGAVLQLEIVSELLIVGPLPTWRLSGFHQIDTGILLLSIIGLVRAVLCVLRTRACV